MKQTEIETTIDVYQSTTATSIPHPLTSDKVLPLTKSGEYFETYTDADHARCLDTGHSTGGYCIIAAGGAVSWSSKRQNVTALSNGKMNW